MGYIVGCHRYGMHLILVKWHSPRRCEFRHAFRIVLITFEKTLTGSVGTEWEEISFRLPAMHPWHSKLFPMIFTDDSPFPNPILIVNRPRAWCCSNCRIWASSWPLVAKFSCKHHAEPRSKRTSTMWGTASRTSRRTF
jgi:hypothetical protein